MEQEPELLLKFAFKTAPDLFCALTSAMVRSFCATNRRGEIRGSVLPGIEVTMGFCFKLGLVLFTSDCGLTAECGVDKSVNTSSTHVSPKCDAYTLFCGTNSHNQCCHCSGFFTRSGVFLFHLNFLLKIWGLFDAGEILEMYVVLLYFPFKNTTVS